MTNNNPIIEQYANYPRGRGAVSRESYEDVYKALQWVYERGVSDGKHELVDVLAPLMERHPQYSSGGATFTLSYDEYDAIKLAYRRARPKESVE